MRALTRPLALGITALAAGTSLAATTWAAGAVQEAAYVGVATADGVRTVVELDDYLVAERIVDGAGPTAQVVADPLGPRGYAALPYPGDTAVAAPGLLSGITRTPLPDYPLMVTSAHPVTPEERVAHEGYHLDTTADAVSATASARSGRRDQSGDAGTAESAARAAVDPRTGTVRAEATTTATSFTAGGVLRLGRVHSRASVVRRSEEEPRREHELVVEGMSVAGQAVALTPDGLAVPGTGAPLPDTSPVRQALAAQRVEVRYLAAEETPDGVVAPGVEVRVTTDVPTTPKPAVTTYTFGRAMALAVPGVPEQGPTGEDDDDLGSDDSFGTGVTAAPAGPGGTGSFAGDPVSLPPQTLGRTDGDGIGSGTPLPGRPAGTSRPAAQWSDTWSATFYLVLVLAGAFTLGAAQLLRTLGVRLSWTS